MLYCIKKMMMLLSVVSAVFLWGSVAQAATHYLSTDFDDYKKQQAAHDQRLMQQTTPTPTNTSFGDTQHTQDTAININQANEQLIMRTLQGVGLVKAKAIVSYRQTHGKFKQVDDLLQVKGIGAATLNKNKHLIYCD